MMDGPGRIRMAFCEKRLVEIVIRGKGCVFFGMDVHGYAEQEIDTHYMLVCFSTYWAHN